MKRINFKLALVIFILTIYSCQNNTNKKTEDSPLEETVVEETPKYYKLIGEEISIRVGPGEEYDKLINKKATEKFGETMYCHADYSFLVEIIEEKEGWTKIRTIKPKHLSKTYNGWIPTSSIKKENKPEQIKKLDAETYEIIGKKSNDLVTNYYILVIEKEFDKTKANTFVKSFRKYNCSGDCNVNLYNSKEIKDIMNKYPLEDNEYLRLADHYIASSTFDAPQYVSWYPYQDKKYKDLGGKNWKKKPIK